MNLFDLWDFGDVAASEVRFRTAADAANRDEEKALALTQLARAQGLQGRFEDARSTLAIADALLVAESVARAQYWIEVGRVENSSGDPQSALPLFARALAMATALSKEYLAVDAAHMMAIAAPTAEQPNYAEQALRLARSASDPSARAWVGPILNNLGWTLVDAGRPEEAISHFRDALEFRLLQGIEAPLRLARYALGCALRASGRPAAAMEELQVAAAMGGSGGFVEEELGECLLDLDRPEEARPWFRRALEKLALTELATSDPERLRRIRSLA